MKLHSSDGQLCVKSVPGGVLWVAEWVVTRRGSDWEYVGGIAFQPCDGEEKREILGKYLQVG